MIRVIAADDFNTGSDDSEPFAVRRKAPLPLIVSPDDGTETVQMRTIVLDGDAIDWEDGPLSGKSLSWESDKDGVIGTGREVETRDLSAGTHQITLEATDSDGMTGSSSITLLVAPGEKPAPPPDLEEMVEGLKKGAPSLQQ